MKNLPGNCQRWLVFLSLSSTFKFLVQMNSTHKVIFQGCPQGSLNSSLLWSQLQHLDVVLPGQVLNDQLGIGDRLAVVIRDPGGLAQRSYCLLEVWKSRHLSGSDW